MRFTLMLKTKLAGLLILALCAMVALPAFAGAQQTSPAQHQYGESLSQIGTGGNPPPSSSDGLGGNVGPLPFTGFDVIAMAAVALAVTGLGLALQRAVSRDTGEEIS